MPWTTETILKAVAAARVEMCVTEERLAELTGLSAKQIENATARLRKHGFLMRTGKGCHKLTQAGLDVVMAGASLRSGPKGHHTGQRNCPHGLRQKAWNVLRMGGKRTLDDILMLIVEGGERDPRSNVRKYLKALCASGHVRTLPQREAPLNATSNGCLRYLLINDSGPLAPVWNVSRKSVYDPNTETVVSIDPAHLQEAA